MRNSSLVASPVREPVTCFIEKGTLNIVPSSETPCKKAVLISLTCEEWKQDENKYCHNNNISLIRNNAMLLYKIFEYKIIFKTNCEKDSVIWK